MNHPVTVRLLEEERYKALILLLITVMSVYLASSNVSYTAIAYAPGASHDWASCDLCHGGLRYKANTRETGDFVFTEFRCMECHYTVTMNETVSIRYTSHRNIGCTCHSVLHTGHWRWRGGYYYVANSIAQGFIGCAGFGGGGGCHNIVSTYVRAPPGADPQQNFYRSFERFDIEVDESKPKSLTLDTHHYGFSTSYVGGFSQRVYAVAFVDPFNIDNVDGVPATRTYVLCLYCHMNHYDGLSVPGQTQSYPLIHEDTCYECHTDYGMVNQLGVPDEHAVKYSEYAWQTCAGGSGTMSCHSTVTPEILNYVDSSVHSGIGCRCHPVVHISRWNGTGSWLFVYAPRGAYAKPFLSQVLESGRLTFFYDAGNSSIFYVPVNEVVDQATGNSSYVVMVYADRRGDASLMVNNTLLRYMMCFNCHFVVDDSSSLAAYKKELEQGLIPIPKSVFENISDPHKINSSLARGFEASNRKSYEKASLALLVIASTLALFLVVLKSARRDSS